MATTTNGETTTTTTAPKPLICPSLLSCDLARLEEEAADMLAKGADWLHMDIMDGHFVPNLTFGPPVIAALRKAQPNAYIDCHLMVTHPHQWVAPLQRAGANGLTFHVESEMPDDEAGIAGLIATIRQAGLKVGLVLKPATPIDAVLPYVNDIDLVLLMTVNPGFSGQKFMPEVLPKVKALRDKCPHLTIQVDGGLSPSTIDAAAQAGANAIVAASAIFGSPDRQAVMDTLRQGVIQAQRQQQQQQQAAATTTT